MSQHKFITCIAISSLLIISCNNKAEEPKEASENMSPSFKEEMVTYSGDGVEMKGFVVYNDGVKEPRPAVLVVPEWWGLNDYIKSRARQLAQLGYVAMAIDMYGGGLQADNPDSAGKLATPFYGDPQMAKRRFDAALEKIKSYSQVDTSQVAAIGYCFGGAQVINMAKMGENLKGVVSFHGNLAVMPPTKDMKAEVLVCHGDDDKFVLPQEVTLFKKQMDSVNAHYMFVSYPGATHSFTNPQATEWGKKFNLPLAYNENADTLSWKEMKQFFGRIFKN